MQFIVITGMSGAGKSTVLKMMEDIGFFCVDNLPPALINKFADICFSPESGINKVALGIDIRGGDLFEELFQETDRLKAQGYEVQVVFLDASDEILIKETRRKHPLAGSNRLEDGINKEREILKDAKKRSTYIFDTSNLLTRELKEEIARIFFEGKSYENLMITIVAFGFKYGIPSDSDLVFDVRFLPNPFYNAKMRPLTGNDAIVRDYVMGFDVSRQFLLQLEEMLIFLLPNYIKEGKNQLVISIGCTGGKHRSVTLANAIYERLKEEDYFVNIHHRDIGNDAKRGH